jgi:hypothetical protein
MRTSLAALALHVLPFHVLTTTPVRGEDSTAAEAVQETLLSGKELIPHLAAFKFEPWYELDELRLWRQIGWKVRLQHLPDSVDAFVDLMRSEQFREDALDIDWQLVASLGIDRLAELPNIESINLSGGIPVIDVQLGKIARLPRLRQLNIAGQSVQAVSLPLCTRIRQS